MATGLQVDDTSSVMPGSLAFLSRPFGITYSVLQIILPPAKNSAVEEHGSAVLLIDGQPSSHKILVGDQYNQSNVKFM